MKKIVAISLSIITTASSFAGNGKSFGAGFAGGFFGSAVGTAMTQPRSRDVVIVESATNRDNGDKRSSYDDDYAEIQKLRRENRHLRDDLDECQAQLDELKKELRALKAKKPMKDE